MESGFYGMAAYIKYNTNSIYFYILKYSVAFMTVSDFNYLYPRVQCTYSLKLILYNVRSCYTNLQIGYINTNMDIVHKYMS
jgi:hypothetical protein